MQKLVIQEKFYASLCGEEAVLRDKGFASPAAFLEGVIARLNDEYNFLDIRGYRFQTKKEAKLYSQYGAFLEGETGPYQSVTLYFTPISSKMGDVIIEQSFMPTICKQMERDIGYLLNESDKKIALLTSRINAENKAPDTYNKMQMDVNSLNTLGFDVIPIFPIKNLSTDTRFQTLTEYLEMSAYLQGSKRKNAQFDYLRLREGILFGDCGAGQWEGEMPKSFCFRFLSAIFSSHGECKFDVSALINRFQKPDNQLANLQKFIDYVNADENARLSAVAVDEDDVVEGFDYIVDCSDIHRKPEKGADGSGRKRYKTQRSIRDFVLEQANYLCDCHDERHFYFESVELHNYVEGHHIIPMNRQEEYYNDKGVNLDVSQNIVSLCPSCHRQIHWGSRRARLEVISELYVRNKAQLLKVDGALTLSLLASYYNIGLMDEEEKDWLKRAKHVLEKR